MSSIQSAVSGAQLSMVATSPRATDPDSRTRFREAVGRGAASVVAGVESMFPFAAGGVSTPLAVRASQSASSAGVDASTSSAMAGGLDAGSRLDSSSEPMQLLALQQRIGDEQQRFSTLSAVMKARHELAKTVIGNVR